MSTRRRRLLALGIGLVLLCAWSFLWPWYSRASTPIHIGSNTHGYTVVNYRVRSPLRVLTEMLDFMPHGRRRAFGPDHGYRGYLCKDGRRIVRLWDMLSGARASVREDGAFYACHPHASDPVLTVVRVADGRHLSFEIPAWGNIRWEHDARVLVWQRDETGDPETLAAIDLPDDFVR